MNRSSVLKALELLGVRLRQERFSLSDIIRGATVELEHTDDTLTATKIAIDHLRELPDYYERLAVMEQKAPRTMRMALPHW